MSIIVTLLAVLIFPLNILLIFLPLQPNVDAGSVSIVSENNDENNDENNSEPLGRVQGQEKEQEEAKIKMNLPERDEKVENLAIPTAHSSVILDVESKEILYNSNEKERRPIASLTKLMTAVLVLEKIGDLNEEVTIDEEAVYAEGTKIGCPRSGYCISPRLKVGEKISVLNLLKAMLMNSANDAAIALAKHVSGTEEKFVELMNKKAKQMGLNNTNFCTSSGLEIEGRETECYSSAYDIAQIAAYSIKYDLIWEIFRLPTNTTISSVDGTHKHQIINTDIVLDQIPNCLGGKTGFTPLAGRSLLIAASDHTGKHKIVAVVLDDPYRWQNIKKMVSWAFRAYKWSD